MKKILLTGATLFVLSFLCLHIFVNIRGKDIVTQKLADVFKRKITIKTLYTTFPANIYIKDIEAQGLFKIDEVVAGGGLIDIFSKDFNLTFLKIIRPSVTLEKAGTVAKPAPAAPEPAVAVTQTANEATVAIMPAISGEAEKTGGYPLSASGTAIRDFLGGFSIGHLIVSEGTVNFTDKTTSDKETVIKVERFNLRIDNLNLKKIGPQITSFELKGSIPWRRGVEKGKIEIEGWINFFKRDMQATIKVSDIDGVYLRPYYSAWIDLEKLGIEKANLNFNSNIHGLNNNVTAECHLELTDIVRRTHHSDEPSQRSERIASAVIDMFKNLDQGRIVLDFTIRTRMDRPEFGLGNIKMAVKEKVAKAIDASRFGPEIVLTLPARLLQGVIKGATDVSKAMVDGAFSLGNEIKKSVEQSLKKEAK